MHMMKKIRIYILTLLCLMLSSVVLAATNIGMILPQPGGQVTLDFYSLNDFQGRVTEDEGAPGAARLAGIMRSLARQNVFGTVFLGGSNMVHGYAPSDKLNGSPAQVALNGMGITADVVNAGTFVNSPKHAGSGYITLGANVLDASGQVAKPFKPSIILSRNGVDVGIIGLCGTKEAAMANAANMAGYRIVPPEEVAQKNIDEVRKYGAKVVILLVSMESKSLGQDGVQGEITGLLSKLHGVDGVITTANGSIVTGKYNGVPVVQAGNNARTLGRIQLTYDRKAKKVTAAETRTYDINGLPLAIDMETAKAVDKALPGFNILKTAKEESKEIIPTGTKGSKGTYVIGRRGVIGAGGFQPATSAKNSRYLPRDIVAVNEQILTNDVHGESLIGDYCTTLLKNAYKADVALYNATSFHAALDTGSISYKNLERIFPDQDRHIIIGEIYGSELRQAIEHGLNKDIGLIRFAGLKVVADLKKPEGQRIQSIKFTNGDALLNEQVYNVVMNDYMYKGNEGYTMLTNARAVMDKGTELDFFKFGFRAFRTINYGGDGRLQLID
jgi:2',3'-cyclic-nucleotide 2'-phosphodiesterase (5'-nucleotidase family)